MKEKISDTVVSLKNEYEQIPVPREARERMLAGIAQAKRENRRRSAVRLLGRTAAAGAAAFKRQAALAFSLGPKHFRQGETERQAGFFWRLSSLPAFQQAASLTYAKGCV